MKWRPPAYLRALRVEIIVPNDGDVGACLQCLGDSVCAQLLRRERCCLLERELHELVLA